MKLGLVARADNTGLGNQTWEFYRHMHPAKTMVVDISKLNGNRQFPERYPENAMFVQGFPNRGDIEAFLEGLDVVFVAEAPYNYLLYVLARSMGIKTAVQYNYEFFDWYSYPHYPTPDLLIAPSKWNFDKVQEFADQRGIKHVYLHCPVNTKVLPFRKIEQFKTFVHIAGRPAAHDRNGTEDFIDSIMHLKTPGLEFIIYCQNDEYIDALEARLDLSKTPDDTTVQFRSGDPDDYTELYKLGDVMVLPRRYGGNCLPMNEAISVGMPVIMPDISPNNNFLEKMWLVEAEKVGEFKPRMIVDIYGVKPELLAAKIDEFANMEPGQVYAHNLIANVLANKISWEQMRLKYIKTLSEL